MPTSPENKIKGVASTPLVIWVKIYLTIYLLYPVYPNKVELYVEW